VGNESYFTNLFYRINRGGMANRPDMARETRDDDEPIQGATNATDLTWSMSDIASHYRQRYSYQNLTDRQRQLLDGKGIREEDYDMLTT